MTLRSRFRRWLGRKTRRTIFVVRALIDRRGHKEFCQDYLRRHPPRARPGEDECR